MSLLIAAFTQLPLASCLLPLAPLPCHLTLPGHFASIQDIWSPYEISSTATIKDGSTMLSEVTDVTRWGTPIGVMPLKRGPERDSLLTMLTADMTGLRTTIEAEYGEWDAGTVFQSDPDNRATSLRQVRTGQHLICRLWAAPQRRPL